MIINYKMRHIVYVSGKTLNR